MGSRRRDNARNVSTRISLGCLSLVVNPDEKPNIRSYKIVWWSWNRAIQLIQQRQLHFLEHILRKPENELVNMYALFPPKHGKRKPGHPMLMFHQYIASIISQAYPPPPEEIRSMVQDRKAWRKLVTNCNAVGWWWCLNGIITVRKYTQSCKSARHPTS